jgi:hypothetical protein
MIPLVVNINNNEFDKNNVPASGVYILAYIKS